MQAQKKIIRVYTQDRALAQHAAEIGGVLGAGEVRDTLTSKYPGIESISLKEGKVFSVQGYDSNKHTLQCLVNIGSPKVTGQQFRKQFTPKKKAEKPDEPHTEIITIDPRELGDMGTVISTESVRPVIESLTGRPGVRQGRQDDEIHTVPDKKKVNWPVINVPEAVSQELAFRPEYRPHAIPRETLRRWFEGYYVGSFVDQSGKVRNTSLGDPLEALEEVNLFRVKLDSKTFEYWCDTPFKFDSETGKIVIPIVGDFFGKDGVITEDLEKQGIVERVRDGDGNPVTIPGFMKTSRQMFIPVESSVRLFEVGGRPILPNSPEAVMEAWNLIHPNGSELLEQFAEGTIRKLHEDGNVQEPFDDYKTKLWRPTLLNAGIRYS